MAPKCAPARQGRGVAKGKATAKAKAAPAWSTQGNRRKREREAALGALNLLAQDVGVHTLPTKTVGPKVQKLIKKLEARIGDDVQAGLLHSAATQWQVNGGRLDAHLAPLAPPSPPPAAAQPALGAQPHEVDYALLPAVIPRHKILTTGYKVHSKAFMVTYNDRAFTPEVWPRFRTFIKAKARGLGATAWAACLEQSLHAQPGPRRPVYHTHGYFLWEDGEGVQLANTNALVFASVWPRVDTCRVRNPAHFRKASYHGLWYVHVVKLGTVKSDANYLPWHQYEPQAGWLVNLWADHKLSHDMFEDLSAEFRTGHAVRMQDLAAVRRTEKTAAVRDHVRREKELTDQFCPLAAFKDFPQVESFLAYFTETSRRRPILVIYGATGLGKSEFAAHVLRKVAHVLGLSDFLEVTVQGNSCLDLSAFDVQQHAGILLDGVGDLEMIADHRETLQGRAKADTGGLSPTMVYAYGFTLCRRAVVVTMDEAAKNLGLLESHHWLADRRNVLPFRLSEPAFVQPLA